MVNLIKEINESKKLTKCIWCECKCKFSERNYNANQCWNNDKYLFERKKRHLCDKDHVWNPATCTYENGKCLPSIMDDSVITCDEIVNS